jgi:glycosyltransferase involved in cell wall biosynthesis
MSEKSLNILIIASWYPNNSDLSGIFIKEQAQLLLRKGHQVTVIHPYLKGTFLGTLKNRKAEISQLNEFGIETIRIGIAPVLPYFKSLSFNELCKKVRKVTIEMHLKIDLIHSHSLYMGGIIAYDLSKSLNIQYIHTEHSSELLFTKKTLQKREKSQLVKIYKNAFKVLFVISFFKDKIKEKYFLTGENFEVIHNIVHTSFFKKPLSQKTEKINKFVAISNLVPVKGIDFLLNAWKDHIEQYPDSFLTIAGDGPLKIQLMNTAELLSINHSINWLPKLNRKEIIEVLDANDALLCTSIIETFGMISAEALSRGKVVLSTDNGGILDIIEENTGIIVKRNQKEFSEALNEIAAKGTSIDPNTLSEYTKMKFSEDVIYSKLNELYNKIVSR